jgi:hypothetical protein
MPETSSAGASKPKLVAVPEGGGEDPRPESAWRERMARCGGPLGLVAIVILVLALVALAVQTRRVGTLAGQVDALEVELSAAHRQIDAYQSQLDLVRESLAGVIEQLTHLQDIVSTDPAPTPEPPADTPPR